MGLELNLREARRIIRPSRSSTPIIIPMISGREEEIDFFSLRSLEPVLLKDDVSCAVSEAETADAAGVVCEDCEPEL